MKQELIDLLVQARERGEIPVSLDPAETAEFLVAGWEGVLMQMKVRQSTAPHEPFTRLVFERLFREDA